VVFSLNSCDMVKYPSNSVTWEDKDAQMGPFETINN
jgi:hypothetical protein